MLLAAGLFGATTICGAIALSSCTFGISDAIKNPNNNSSNDLINPDLNNNGNVNKPSTPTLAIGIDSNPEIHQQSNYATITLKSNQTTTSTREVSINSAEETNSFTFSLENSSTSNYGTFSFVTSVEEDGNSTSGNDSSNSTNQEFATTETKVTENSSITLDFSNDQDTPKTLSLKFTKAANSNYNIANISIQSSLGNSTLTVAKKTISNDGSSMLLDVTLPAYHLSDNEINPFYSNSNSLNISAIFLENQREN